MNLADRAIEIIRTPAFAWGWAAGLIFAEVALVLFRRRRAPRRKPDVETSFVE